jgi:hypothetical protein
LCDFEIEFLLEDYATNSQEETVATR